MCSHQAESTQSSCSSYRDSNSPRTDRAGFLCFKAIACLCVTSDDEYVSSAVLARTRPTNMHSRYATDKGAYVVTARFRLDDQEVCLLRRVEHPPDRWLNEGLLLVLSCSRSKQHVWCRENCSVKQQGAIRLSAMRPDSRGTDTEWKRQSKT